MRVEFTITHWAAWAPGLTSQEAWQGWAAAPPIAPRGPETPPLTEVPAMARRRVEKLGRPAFQVAQWCQGEARGFPLIFASRHGDPGRGADLLTSLAKGEPLSPTSFALSVHNAIGAQYSIIRADTANVVAVSTGLFTLESAVVEAVAHLGDGHDEVMIVFYDAGPPLIFAGHYDEPAADFAFAWRLRRPSFMPSGVEGEASDRAGSRPSTAPGVNGEGDRPAVVFALETADVPPTRSEVLPHGLSVFRFFLGTEASYSRGDSTAGWKWSRRA